MRPVALTETKARQNFCTNRDRVARGVAQRGATPPLATWNYFETTFDRFDRVCLGLKVGRGVVGIRDIQEIVIRLTGNSGWGQSLILASRGTAVSPSVRDQCEKLLAKVTAAIDIVGELAGLMEITQEAVPGLDRQRLEAAVGTVTSNLPDSLLEPTGGEAKDYRFKAAAVSDNLWDRLALLTLAKIYDIPFGDS